jgi:hypothetical protein
MPGTSLDNIDFDNNDTANAIDEALNEINVTDSQAIPSPDTRAPPQYNPQPPQQQQYIPQPQYPQQYPQQPEHFQRYQQYTYPQESSFRFSFTFPDIFKKTLILFILMILINNGSFKNILTKIPMTINSEGQHTFIMTLIVALIVSIVFFITGSVF